MEHIGTIVAILALALHAIGTLVGVTRALGKMEISLGEKITIERKEIDSLIGEVRQDFADKFDEFERRYGETAASLREKINITEKSALEAHAKLLAEMNSFAMWARDQFVRRDGFYKVRDDLQSDIKELGKQINDRLDRMTKAP